MAIKYSDLFDRIGKFAEHISSYLNERIRIGKIIGPYELKSLWKHSDNFPKETGLYVYSRPSGEVIYVGMGSVRDRVWHHLRSPHLLTHEGNDKEQGFPEHRWIGSPNLSVDDHHLFSSGSMLVSAVSVQPGSLARMLEGYAIWRLKKETNGRCLNVAD